MGNLLQNSYISNYYNEYFKLIDIHKDKTRHSVFCLYLNINKSASIYDFNTSSSLTRYFSGVAYDSYEQTPVLTIDSLIDSSQNDTQFIGLKLNAETRMTTYTIKSPTIGDLVIFPYSPNNSSEIFRVKEVQTSLSARNNNNAYFFQLGLEYAPIKNINDIKLINNYIYLNICSGYHLLKPDYISFMNEINELNYLLKNAKFDNNLELYLFEYDYNYYIDLKENNTIYNFLNNYRNYFPLFLKVPFGIKNFKNIDVVLNLNLDCEKNIVNKKSKINLIEKLISYEQRRY